MNGWTESSTYCLVIAFWGLLTTLYGNVTLRSLFDLIVDFHIIFIQVVYIGHRRQGNINGKLIMGVIHYSSVTIYGIEFLQISGK